jgi:hypothetical protein
VRSGFGRSGSLSVSGTEEESDIPHSSPTLYQQNVWNTGILSEGTHTVTIECTGTNNPPSTGYKIAVDSVDIVGLPGEWER